MTDHHSSPDNTPEINAAPDANAEWGDALPEVPRKVAGELPGFFQKPGRVRLLTITLVVVCVLLALADLVYAKHPYFGVEYALNFYGFYAFLACIALVLVAKLLRPIVQRSEDYYDR